MFLCVVIGQGAWQTIVNCDPIYCIYYVTDYKDPVTKLPLTSHDITYQPFPILVGIYIMVAGLHSFILPELRASLDMMKFALNHQNRFHSW